MLSAIENTHARLSAHYPEQRELLLQYLVELQFEQGHISQQAISLLAEKLDIRTADVHAVISFYAFLKTQPGARYQLLFTDGIIERFNGSEVIRDKIQTALKALPAGWYSIDHTSCTGLSDQPPSVIVNGRSIAQLTDTKAEQLINLIRNNTPVDAWPGDLFKIDNPVHRKDILLASVFKPGSALKKLDSLSPADLLNTVRQSGLRGRGGAGYPTALKWQACRDIDAADHYVVCNADEGEPGTFKDRLLLEHYADGVIEGMTICAAVTSAKQGFIYLRAEYRHLLQALLETLEQRRKNNLLGSAIAGINGFDFDIDIHLGAGAYICGEESALIESLEGKAGIPRSRPPFPVSHGYRNMPTVVNNVETFFAAARIIEQGAAWFSDRGTSASAGTKLISISGDCSKPGIYEYPFGTSVRRILQDCGASETRAVQVSGAAGVLLSETEFENTLCFEDIPSSGSFMIFNRDRDLLQVIRNFAAFFKHESCGFCTPCRVGTGLMPDLLEKLSGQYSQNDLDDIRTLADLMKTTSHCGLGGSAANSVLDLLDKFHGVLPKPVDKHSLHPAFDIQQALHRSATSYANQDLPGRLK